jgi:hypothetical protein
MYKIYNTSMFTGELRSMDMPVSPAKIQAWRESPDRPLIQDAFPELTVDQREFILTGIIPNEWEGFFSED